MVNFISVPDGQSVTRSSVSIDGPFRRWRRNHMNRVGVCCRHVGEGGDFADKQSLGKLRKCEGWKFNQGEEAGGNSWSDIGQQTLSDSISRQTCPSLLPEGKQCGSHVHCVHVYDKW